MKTGKTEGAEIDAGQPEKTASDAGEFDMTLVGRKNHVTVTPPHDAIIAAGKNRRWYGRIPQAAHPPEDRLAPY